GCRGGGALVSPGRRAGRRPGAVQSRPRLRPRRGRDAERRRRAHVVQPRRRALSRQGPAQPHRRGQEPRHGRGRDVVRAARRGAKARARVEAAIAWLFPVVPAKAGTHIPEAVVMGSRLRGNDTGMTVGLEHPRASGEERRSLSGRPREGHPATQASRGPRCGDPYSRAVVIGSRLRGNDTGMTVGLEQPRASGEERRSLPVVPAGGTPRRKRRGDPVAGTHLPELWLWVPGRSAVTRVHSPRRRASTPLRTRYARERHRDDRCKTAALFLLGVLRHGDAVRVDADGATHEPGSGGKICWCRRADSNRQPIAYEAL